MGGHVWNYCTCGQADASCRLDIPNFKPEAEEGAGRAGEGQEHTTSTRNISPTRETESFSHLQVVKKKKGFTSERHATHAEYMHTTKYAQQHW